MGRAARIGAAAGKSYDLKQLSVRSNRQMSNASPASWPGESFIDLKRSRWMSNRVSFPPPDVRSKILSKRHVRAATPYQS